jgi:hypothetical protein
VSDLRRLAVSGEGRHQVRVRTDALLTLKPGQTPATLRLVRSAAGRATVTWDSGEFPLAIARETGTGTVLGIGKTGVMTVATASDRMDVLLSDGLGSSVTSLLVK